MRSIYVMPFGAEVRPDGSVRFRLWAPAAKSVALYLQKSPHDYFPLTKLEGGWFELSTGAVGPGTRYRFQIDGERAVPDPASRFQPCDVHGPSEVVDSAAFDWSDNEWRGRTWEETVIYELHVGTFTPEGTFQGVERKLEYLKELGVTALELMPIADFAGTRNWGYDGVLPFAPDSSYGCPEDLKRLIQAAHSTGLMVFLDVVYNHFGPEGNYMRLYAPQFFTSRHHTPWGEAINFDGADGRTVRDFFIHNALYWLEEYHLDGLRLDAVHAIVDDSDPHFLTELAGVVRQRFEGERFVYLILENGDNAAHYLRRNLEGGPCWFDAQWNDDIHHALHVLTTGESDGYYSDYVGQPLRHLGRCLAEGFAYQGEYSEYHRAARGEPSSGLPPGAFISFVQNHDQVGNRAFGERLIRLAPARALRAALEVLLLAPSPPMLFMGEEFGAASPFLFFCDFEGDLAHAVTAGRRDEFARFAKFVSTRGLIPDPNAPETFRQSKLDWGELDQASHAQWLRFYRELLSLRQRLIVPLLRMTSGTRSEYRDFQNQGLVVEWEAGGTQLRLAANLGDEWLSSMTLQPRDTFYSSSPEAADASAHGRLPPWSVLWSLQS